jgi:hypothetical protein
VIVEPVPRLLITGGTIDARLDNAERTCNHNNYAQQTHPDDVGGIRVDADGSRVEARVLGRYGAYYPWRGEKTGDLIDEQRASLEIERNRLEQRVASLRKLEDHEGLEAVSPILRFT